MTHYNIPKFFAHKEEDVFENGCDGAPINYMEETSIDAASREEMIEKIAKHFCVNKDAIITGACDEKGRVDVTRYEDEEGCFMTENEMAAWEKGEKRAWLCVYTGYLRMVSPDASW